MAYERSDSGINLCCSGSEPGGGIDTLICCFDHTDFGHTNVCRGRETNQLQIPSTAIINQYSNFKDHLTLSIGEWRKLKVNYMSIPIRNKYI